ncbi:MAG: flagella basal body P-ring formation protein FlgA [Anaerolineae bacterium]|nr:flagella basal body P-ring formation protein FlgA [Anaerolineae bacterium]
MSARKVILFLIAAALLVVVLIMQIRGPRTAETEQESMTVVVAGHDIPPYTILESADLTTSRVPPSEAVKSYVRVEQLVGKMLTDELRNGNIIRSENVVDLPSVWSDDMLIASFDVPTARIVGGQLRQGHFIDLLVTRPETQNQFSEALWLASNLWVADVRQSSGAAVARPTAAALPSGAVAPETQPTPRSGGFSLGGFSGATTLGAQQGPANLVVIAAHRETVRTIADYLGARLYDPWIVVRPGQAAAETVGRIEGIVFYDMNENLFQERNEMGLDGVEITLYDERNVAKKRIQALGGGRFSFDDLAPGIYYVEEEDPEEFTSISANKLQVEVVAGQTHHVMFADAKKVTGPESEGAAVAQAMPLETPLPRCDFRMVISARRDGPELTQALEPNAQSVWAVIRPASACPADVPLEVRAYHEPSGESSGHTFLDDWRANSAQLSVELRSWQGQSFAPGTYIATLVGEDGAILDVASWRVAAPEPAPEPASTAAPIIMPKELPVTGAEILPREIGPQTRFGFDRGY